jgi:hypothetical protein
MTYLNLPVLALPVLTLTALLAACGAPITPAPEQARPDSTGPELTRPADLPAARGAVRNVSALTVSDAWRGTTWRTLKQGEGVTLVGADDATNAEKGDTAATADLPLLCLNVDGRPAPKGVDSWVGGEVRLSPAVNGTSLTSRKVADLLCATEFGGGWRVAGTRDGTGWQLLAAGQTDPDTRFWVAAEDAPANPWNSDGERPDAVIPDTTHVLGAEDRAGLLRASEDGRVLVFRSGAPILRTLKEGMALVSRPADAAPAGLLGRVKALERGADTTTVYTSEVSLEEIIQDGALDAAVKLDSSMIDFEKSGSAIRMQEKSLGAQRTFNFFSFSRNPFCLYDHAARSLGCDDGQASGLRSRVPATNYVTLDGQLSARADAFVNVNISWFRLQHFDAGVQLSESARATLFAKGSYMWNVNRDLTQWQVVFSPITFTIGPVPVVITPILVPTVGTNGQITATLRYEASQSFTGRYGVEYNRGSGWRGINTNTWTFSAPPAPTATASAQASAYLGAKGILALYSTSTSGPQVFVHAKPFVEGQASGTFGPGQTSYSLCAYAGVRVDAGAAFPLVSSAPWQAQVLNWRQRIYSHNC